MSRSGNSVHLLVPGLFGPMPALEKLPGTFAVPGLETLLARSDGFRWPGRDLESTLFSFCATERTQQEDYPVAAFRRVGDGGSPDRNYWLQANPVHLRADRDRLLLFAAEDLGLSQREATQLALLVERHFAAQGWQIELPLPHRWYLTLERTPALRTQSLDDVFGRNIERYLTGGPDALHWHGILNEIQMLLHTAEVNRRREDEGRPTVNGIWFSGGGFLPEKKIELPFDRVFGDEALARGLARLAALPAAAFPRPPGALLTASGSSLVVCDDLRWPVLRADPRDWFDTLIAFDRWLEALVQGVGRKQLRELWLYPCNGKVYRLDRAALRRFWRWRKRITGYLDSNPE